MRVWEIENLIKISSLPKLNTFDLSLVVHWKVGRGYCLHQYAAGSSTSSVEIWTVTLHFSSENCPKCLKLSKIWGVIGVIGCTCKQLLSSGSYSLSTPTTKPFTFLLSCLPNGVKDEFLDEMFVLLWVPFSIQVQYEVNKYIKQLCPAGWSFQLLGSKTILKIPDVLLSASYLNLLK